MLRKISSHSNKILAAGMTKQRITPYLSGLRWDLSAMNQYCNLQNLGHTAGFGLDHKIQRFFSKKKKEEKTSKKGGKSSSEDSGAQVIEIDLNIVELQYQEI